MSPRNARAQPQTQPLSHTISAYICLLTFAGHLCSSPGSSCQLGPIAGFPYAPRTPLWFLITPMMKPSLRVQLERALFPWEPLQFFESSLTARVYLCGPLSLSYFLFFPRVCAHAEDSFLESVPYYHAGPLIQFGSSNLVASVFYLLSHLPQPVYIL